MSFAEVACDGNVMVVEASDATPHWPPMHRARTFRGSGSRPILAAVTAPQSIDELMARARALAGLSLGSLSERAGLALGHGVHAKGKPGALLEVLLGATGGSLARHDFPDLRVELKTIPLDGKGAPLESTYVCRVPAADADRAEWTTSWAKQKLSLVLFVPIRARERRTPFAERIVGSAFLWSPSEEQDALLHADFDDIMGAIALGGAETLTAHVGRILQARPKAADGSARMRLVGPDGEAIRTVPRGFYLRPSFTASLLTTR